MTSEHNVSDRKPHFCKILFNWVAEKSTFFERIFKIYKKKILAQADSTANRYFLNDETETLPFVRSVLKIFSRIGNVHKRPNENCTAHTLS